MSGTEQSFDEVFAAAVEDAEKMEAAQGAPEESDDDGVQDEGSEGDQAAEAEGQVDDDSDESEEELEKKPGKPKVSEWVSLRREKQKIRERREKADAEIAAREQQLTARIDELAAKAATRFEPLQEAAKALADGDWDTLAKALGRASKTQLESWNDLNTHVAKRYASPEYSEVRRLRAEQEEYRKSEEQRRKQQEQQAAQARQAQERQRYVADLATQLKDSADPAIKAMSFEGFAQDVYQEQARAWDAKAQRTISVDEAAQRALKRARGIYDRLHRVFGDQAPNPAKLPAGGQRKHRTVSQRKAVGASPTGEFKDDREAIEWGIREMQAALEADYG